MINGGNFIYSTIFQHGDSKEIFSMTVSLATALEVLCGTFTPNRLYQSLQSGTMNVEELSMIGPDVDLEAVDAINKKRLLAFVNHFVINTSLFLNKLSKSCEHGLMKLENKIQKLETSIIILESKLNSVPGLDVKEATEAVVPDVEKVEKVEEVEEVKNENENEERETESEVQTLDPAYMKYVKMLQFGVPPPAVKLKMEQEGVEPSLHEVILNYGK